MPTIQLGIPTDSFGKWADAGLFPPSFPPGTELFMQYWYLDLFKSSQVAATNTIAAITP